MAGLLGWLKRKKWLMLNAILVGLLVGMLGIQVVDESDAVDQSVKIGVGNEKVITLGHIAYAAGLSVDYTYDGTDDNVQFQAALNALPATGGRLLDVSAVQKNFSATVTRAIDNVVITGAGQGSYFANNGVTALFTAGGNGWKFEDLRTDAGGINMGATTGWQWIKVNNGSADYDWRTPNGSMVTDNLSISGFQVPKASGTPDYVVGVNTAADDVPGSSGYWVKSGVTGQVIRSTADTYADDDTNYAIGLIPAGGVIQFTVGTFSINTPIIPTADINLRGEGFSSIVQLTSGANTDVIRGGATASRVSLSDFRIDGNKAGNASGSSVNITDAGGGQNYWNIDHMLITNSPSYGIVKDYGWQLYVRNSEINVSGINNISIGGNVANGVFIINNVLEASTGINVNFGAPVGANGANHKIAFNHFEGGAGSLNFQGYYSSIDHNYFVTSNAGGNPIVNLVYTYNTFSFNNIHNSGDTTTAIQVYSGYSIIEGNIIESVITTGGGTRAVIHVLSNDVTVKGNFIRNNSALRGINATGYTGGLITENQVIGNAGGICEGIRGGEVIANNIVQGNEYGIDATGSSIVTGNNVYGNPSRNLYIPAGYPGMVRNNIGYVSENSGTATILSGNDAVVVSHGLSTNATSVLLTGTHDEVRDTIVTTITATQFTITAAANVTANRDVYWRATVGAGN